MVWFFQRSQLRLHYEVRREANGPHYELVITHPDGREELETYTDPVAVMARSERLHRMLVEAGWRSLPAKYQSGAPGQTVAAQRNTS